MQKLGCDGYGASRCPCSLENAASMAPKRRTPRRLRNRARPPPTLWPPRVRNYLRQEMASFLGLCEYTERADAARARSYFFDRRKRVRTGGGWGL